MILFNKSKNRPVPHEDMETQRTHSRRLPLDGHDNFRDLGGCMTIDGRSVRRGMLYRCGSLDKLSKNDQVYLQQLGIRCVTDFRSEYERRRKPDKLPAGIDYLHMPIAAGGEDIHKKVMDFIAGKIDTAMVDFMKQIYDDLVNKYTAVYRQWISDMLYDEPRLPQVFHCSAGKDRTGFAAVIIERILGVSEETIMEDYLVTNKYNRRLSAKIVRQLRFASGFKRSREDISPLFRVDEEYLAEAFSAIEVKWGSFDNYCESPDGLALDKAGRNKLQALFLE